MFCKYLLVPSGHARATSPAIVVTLTPPSHMVANALKNGTKNDSTQNTAQPQEPEAKKDENIVSQKGFELADMAVDEIEVVMAPAKKVRAQPTFFFPVTPPRARTDSNPTHPLFPQTQLTAAEKRALLRQSTLAEIATQRKPDNTTPTTTKSGARAVARPSLPDHNQ